MRSLSLTSLSPLPFTLSVLGLAACASTPPPVAPTPAPAARVAEIAAPPPPDLAAIPDPEGLVAFARLAKPSEALKVMGGWMHVPMPGADKVGALVTGEPTGDAIDLDQPIDYVVTLKGQKKRGAISAAVRSLDDAKKVFARYKLVPSTEAGGALRIEGLGEGGESEAGGSRYCALVPAFGPATTRLVCGDSEDALRELAPWLTRSAPRATYPADLHVDVRLAPVRPLVDQFRRMLPLLAGGALGVRRGEAPAVDEAFRAFIDDLADFTGDADTIAVDAMVADPQASVTVTSAFRGTTSLLARLAVAHPERAGAPPAAFWKLPADTDAAFFHRGIDPADFDHVRDRLGAMLGAWLEKESVPEPDRKAVRDAAAHTLDLWSAPAVAGKGVDVAEAARAAAALQGAKDDAGREEAERVAAEKMAGWFAMEVDAPAAKVTSAAREWAAVWARPAVAKWVKASVHDAPPPAIKMAPLPKGVSGKDAAHLEIIAYRPHHLDKGAKKKPPVGKPMTLHALIVPDASATWLVFAAEESVAVAKAKELLTPAGASALASRAGVGAMKDARVNAGGFVTARTFFDGSPFTWALSDYWNDVRKRDLANLASTPDQGMTPVTYQFASQPGGGAAPAGTFVAKLTVPKGAIETLVQMVH